MGVYRRHSRPDRDDFEMLEFNMFELNKNNNYQIVINQNVNDRLNNVTKLIKWNLECHRQGQLYKNEIIITLQNRIRLIKEQLLYINYVIQSVKNSLILNKLEVKLAFEKLKKEKMPFASVEKAVEYARVSVIYNYSMILYVI